MADGSFRHETRLERRRRRARARLEEPRSRRGLRFLLLVVVGVLVAVALTRAPDALARMELFQVQEIRLDGARHLTVEEVRETAALPPGFSVFDERAPVARRVEGHPMVARARVSRRWPSTLVVEVEEREAVAFHATPTLVVVDREGQPLPLDPVLHRLDLPVVEAATPGGLRRVATEVARVGEMEPGVAAVLSDAVALPDGSVALHLSDPDVVLLYRPPLAPARLRRGLRVLTDALDRRPDRMPSAVDLRFADQVVVRWGPTPELAALPPTPNDP
ncbi:MAG: FtsQ-type POTRA domain-containing protein [Gemmatimonadales bacterium]|nr:MAG: FtsQ-type POTRA domain-containing protein [Gemmatimonadales bacterium]